MLKRIMFRNLEDAVRRGRSGKEIKEWTDCVQDDVRAFGIARGWKETTWESEVYARVEEIRGRRS